MKIIVPNIKDYESVNELALQVHELHVKWRPDIFNRVENVILKEEFEELIENKEIYIANINNKIVGYIIFNIVEKKNQNPKFRYRRQLNIDAMCVDENYRRKGVGSSLLNHIKQIALDNNCTDIYLTVNEENISAIKTYEKFGMKVKNIAYSMQLKK